MAELDQATGTSLKTNNHRVSPVMPTRGTPIVKPAHSNEIVLAATGIHKRYGALAVLDGVDFSLKEGEAVGIVGPNGAGKTTLLSVLSGAVPANAGSVRFQGEDISVLPAPERCRLGLVRTHQIPRPFGGMTVFENAFVAASNGTNEDRDACYTRAIEALRLGGMMDVANRRAETLGLLGRKRLELVRALATGPSVLLLDEIGGGLTDGEAAELVTTIVELRRRGIAIVWIEHVVHVLLQVAERLVCMAAGKIIADGPPKDVMSNRAVVDAYLGADFA